jgi:hypothetical protein
MDKDDAQLDPLPLVIDREVQINTAAEELISVHT